MKTRILQMPLYLAMFLSWQISLQTSFPVYAQWQWNQSDTRVLKIQTDIPGGTVSGVWTRGGSPYRVNGSVTVPNDSTLTIEPGVEVVFMGHYMLNVEGRLLAVGTQEDSIRFSAADTLVGWHGIRFQGTQATNDTSKIVYCVLRNGNANIGTGFDKCGGAMFISQFDKVLVSNCLFDSNAQTGEEMDPVITGGPAIYIYQASPVITHSTFSHNHSSKSCGIGCLSSCDAIVSYNIFTKNSGGWAGPLVALGSGCNPIFSGNIIFDNIGGNGGGGILIERGAIPRVENNIVINNQAPIGAGIICYRDAHPILLNNTIAFNIASSVGGGIAFHTNSSAVLINNILYGNRGRNGGNQICVYDGNSTAQILYCNVEGGRAGIWTPANFIDTMLYEHNIDIDPLILSTMTKDYRLSDESPCIGTGCDSVQVGSIWYHVPQFCLAGTPRPSPVGSKPDMGAYENLLENPAAAYACDIRLSRPYNRPGLDTVCVTAVLVNPLHHSVTLSAVVADTLGAVRDSVPLYDDGLHGDGSTADGLWGCRIYAPSDEGFFNVNVRTEDITQGISRSVTSAVPFTTAGPVTLDHLVVTKSSSSYKLKPYLRNYSTTCTIHGAKLTLICEDPWVKYISPTQYSIPDLAPGENAETNSFTVKLNDAIFPGYFNVNAEIFTDDQVYWTDSTRVYVSGTGVANENEGLPVVFALEQNYPNPFNPTTSIQYEMPSNEDVTIRVYNSVGQEVDRLVDKRQEAGRYDIQWDGSEQASGIYVLRFQAGSYQKNIKMILLR
jgi:hypothetical protein